MKTHPEEDAILDVVPPPWAVERAMSIADCTYPPMNRAIVDLIAMNLWLAFTKGETAALNSVASEQRNARSS
jgi:hypothetical protein